MFTTSMDSTQSPFDWTVQPQPLSSVLLSVRESVVIDLLNVFSTNTIARYTSVEMIPIIKNTLFQLLIGPLKDADVYLVTKEVILRDSVSLTYLVSKGLACIKSKLNGVVKILEAETNKLKFRDDLLVLIYVSRLRNQGINARPLSNDKYRDLHQHWDVDVGYTEISIDDAEKKFKKGDYMEGIAVHSNNPFEEPIQLDSFSDIFMEEWLEERDPMVLVGEARNFQDVSEARNLRIGFTNSPFGSVLC